MSKRRVLLTGAIVPALLVALIGLRHTAARAGTIDPHDFVRRITNPYMPLRQGSVWVYRGVKDGQTQKDVVRVTGRVRYIEDVPCTVVKDVSTHGRRVLERTEDYYTQDRAGNVWYFGERTAAYENGRVDRSGSWIAGRRGAQPGIFMNAHPAVGDTHRQEYLRGEAEDQYWLVDLDQRARVPFGSFPHAALTLEWTRLEPGVIDKKYYVRGIGDIAEITAAGPHETALLVRYHAG